MSPYGVVQILLYGNKVPFTLQVRRYEQMYESALREMPTGWRAIGEYFVCTLTDVARSVLTSRFTKSFGGRRRRSTPSESISPVVHGLQRGVFKVIGQIHDVVKSLTSGATAVDKKLVATFQGFDAFFISMAKEPGADAQRPEGASLIELMTAARRLMQTVISDTANGTTQLTDEQKRTINARADQLLKDAEPAATTGNGADIRQEIAPNNMEDKSCGSSSNSRFKVKHTWCFVQKYYATTCLASKNEPLFLNR